MQETQPEVPGGGAIGSRSIAYLIQSYRHPAADSPTFLDDFEKKLGDAGWQRAPVDDASLLPHLDAELAEGRFLRAYKDAGKMGNYFSARSSFRFHAERGKRTLDVTIPEAPVLYVFETGFVFVTLGVRPSELTLDAYSDLCGGMARRGLNRLAPDAMPAKASEWVNARAQRGIPGTTLRDWLAALVPEIVPTAPSGGRDNPVLFGVLYAEELSPVQRHRLRLLQSANQHVEPSAGDAEVAGHPAIWQPSAPELCLFSRLGVIWAVHPAEPEGLLASLDTTVRDRYLYKWLLVEHQRLQLLGLSERCARISGSPEAEAFAGLRKDLLQYTARYNVGHLSDEERHDHFYRRARQVLDIEGLVAEVREEIVEVDDYLASRRGDVLNVVLGFLTLVLTPVGIVVGIFQREVLPPGQFHLSLLATERFWRALLSHWPLWFVLVTAVVGALGFRRVIGKAKVVSFTRHRARRGTV